MKTITLTDSRMEALRALGFCQYLTPEQFVQWGVCRDKSNLCKRVLKPLRDSKPALVLRKRQGAAKEDIYCLTRRGAMILGESTRSEIVYPRDGVQFSTDFSHRRRTIDFLIQLYRWSLQTESGIEFVHAYYTKAGAQRSRKPCHPITRHQIGTEIFEPDLEFRLQMTDGQSRLFAFEFHNGRDSQKIVDQLMLHTRAVSAGTLSKHHRHPFANYVLSVYAHPPTMRSVQARLGSEASFKAFRPHFLFNTLQAVLRQFDADWHLVDGESSNLLSITKQKPTTANNENKQPRGKPRGIDTNAFEKSLAKPCLRR